MMLGLALDYSRRSLVQRNLPIPTPLIGSEVLVHITGVGVCGTDRDLAHFQIGAPPPGDDYLIIGHEAVGEVVATGPQVKALAVGDCVVPTVRRACDPPCRWCRDARRDLCVTGRYTERGILQAHGYLQELAVDREEDLIRLPPGYAELGVLLEPLSVVEKAVSRAFELHPAAPETALVLGAGTIGLLAAMVLQLRGLNVDVCSLEEPHSYRANLVSAAGARYVRVPDRKADLIIEAAGAPAAAALAVQWLAPLGVAVILGARRVEDLPLLPLIFGNATVTGSVNASPQAFLQAVSDLPALPASLIRQMISIREWREAHDAILGEPAEQPKQVVRLPD